MTKRKKGKQQQQQQQQGGGNNGQKSNSYPKRPRLDEPEIGGFEGAKGYIDPSTGQRGAFPGLDAFDEEFYGPPADGMDYLRMVRSEAKGVPDLLLSSTIPRPPPRTRPPPPPTNTDEILLDYDDPPAPPSEPSEPDHCIFSESTYVSLAPTPAPPPLPLHHAPLLRRYRALRASIRARPPPLAAARNMPRWSDAKALREFVGATSPRPGVLWGLQQWEVLRLLGEFAGWIEWRVKVRNAATRGVARGWPVWIWALLVRCEDCLQAEEVSVLRELAKAALRMWEGMRKVERERVRVRGEKEGEGEEDEKQEEGGKKEDGEGEETGVKKEEAEEKKDEPEEKEDGEIEEGEVQHKPTQPDFCTMEDTMAMLDMIISIVGDFYGQRDLLQERSTMGP